VQDWNDTKLLQTEDGADIQRCLQFVRIYLSEQLGKSPLRDVSTICIHQPHRSKKHILFTCWLVGIVIAESKGCHFLWSSDSDSIMTRGSVAEAIRVLSSKSTVGGVSTRLRSFNNHPTLISRMISAQYWFDQDVKRMQSAVSGCSECQPGPCAAFRIQALKQTIRPWYTQRVLGHIMVCYNAYGSNSLPQLFVYQARRLLLKQVTNEDRHITTNLLLQNWEVHYVPTGLVLTESPRVFSAWLRQQLRWSRATHIERLSYGLLFIKMNSWLAFHVWREEIFPLVSCVSMMEFLLRGKSTLQLAAMDFILEFLVQFTYTLITSIDSPPSWRLLAWVVPSLVFHSSLKPAVHIWGLITTLDSSWGSINTPIDPAASSSPENALEKGFNEASYRYNGKPKGLVARRWYEVGFIVVWLAIISGFWARRLAEELNTFHPNLLRSGAITGISTGISAIIWYWVFFRDLYQVRGVK
jgi:hyaluronan synthase